VLAIATSVIVGGTLPPIASAADFAGDCCADLQQRVAELESNTARKGDRTISLTIEGQVDKIIMWWDDGLSSKTYYGVENRNSSTRFSILGATNVTSATKIGFEIMLDNKSASSASLTQWDADGKNNSLITPLAAPSFAGNNADNYFAAARRMVVWLEDAKLGRISLGRYDMAGAVSTIDLAGIGAAANANERHINGGFLLRGPAGQYYAVAWRHLVDFTSEPTRQNEVRYDSPTFAGFVFSASLADDGSNWGTMLRYADKFSGYRIAAGIGYEHYGQIASQANCFAVTATECANPPGYGPANQAAPAPDITVWGVGISGLHIATGLFAQGHYIHADYDENAPTTAIRNGFFFQRVAGRVPADQWLIQGGISKNWLGFGDTSVFGEYSRNTGWGAAGGMQAPSGLSYSAATTPGAQSVFGVSNTAVIMLGFGIQQNVDAAATELFLAARRFSADVTCSATGANCTGAAAPIGSVALQRLQTEDFWAVIGGARVKF
jgi:hypothetical protein